MVTVNDVTQMMFRWAPPELAMDWDNVGLLVGRGDREVHRVLVALRPEKYTSSQRFASANSGCSFFSVCSGRILPKYRCPLNHRPMIASPSQASVMGPSGDAYSVV